MQIRSNRYMLNDTKKGEAIEVAKYLGVTVKEATLATSGQWRN